MKTEMEFYPKMIRDLPEIDIPVDGVRGWLVQYW